MAKRFDWSSLRSPAKTAYGHLSWIRKLILDEPKRYNQKSWIVGPRVEPSLWSHHMDKQISLYAAEGLPQCGTVACVAGWAIASFQETYPKSQINISFKAEKLLGLTESQADELFGGDAIEKLYREKFGYDSDVPKPQTSEFAALGAEHIANFQQKYKSQLKRTKLVRGKR